uniref:Uncharacterized protein n=1 Tax=Anguilla anguilla TaxID=7936 RepID=A0A0E9SMK3_ANGAN
MLPLSFQLNLYNTVSIVCVGPYNIECFFLLFVLFSRQHFKSNKIK